ncbi:hypothetical protein A8926_3749 [Saccharopolyspora spinosa]|uniref:Uncharacterized protein n=1 Tax=Saccharopolyspora spinosa TaxID=60894 RepID=A0A2N3XZ53_SACSN|nr:hypothetical protein A8926_3749 [Saccharopolyspora spinosa]
MLLELSLRGRYWPTGFDGVPPACDDQIAAGEG